VTGEAIELWLIDLDALREPLTERETRDPYCPPGELDALDGSRKVARMALRRLLARSFGRTLSAQPFQAGPYGKPQLAGLGGDFNVSHTSFRAPSLGVADTEARAVALVGLGKVASIGVDIEPLRAAHLDARRRAAIIAAGTAVAEGAPLPDVEELAVIQAWARLEAWGKANGRGIGRTLSYFGIWGRGGARPGTFMQSHGDQLIVHDVVVPPGLLAAVALPSGVAPPCLTALPVDPAALDEILAHPATV
jgi:4'-phosphopantetheinyl transferase